MIDLKDDLVIYNDLLLGNCVMSILWSKLQENPHLQLQGCMFPDPNPQFGMAL